MPFFLRHGKRLPKRETVIAVQFHHAPKILFNRSANLPPNVLMIRIQPDEGFSFDVMAKRPGLGLAISPVRMNLHYEIGIRQGRFSRRLRAAPARRDGG